MRRKCGVSDTVLGELRVWGGGLQNRAAALQSVHKNGFLLSFFLGKKSSGP